MHGSVARGNLEFTPDAAKQVLLQELKQKIADAAAAAPDRLTLRCVAPVRVCRGALGGLCSRQRVCMHLRQISCCPQRSGTPRCREGDTCAQLAVCVCFPPWPQVAVTGLDAWAEVVYEDLTAAIERVRGGASARVTFPKQGRVPSQVLPPGPPVQLDTVAEARAGHAMHAARLGA